ncbi:hypothetical protein DDZ14_03945 [Maritimibacter sp. 55A14]|uniref:hypothetical protein n=1 Tax=Maritimibacter sp. 55A14 TaxID=2174844 RepID=UPI000D6033E4|nr:hypothetical protein [Maritimibacter sp. 55A14]PWE33822.1 hypothetical protein DDZ14_03945 [Maritimibacter sp. 55A14]
MTNFIHAFTGAIAIAAAAATGATATEMEDALTNGATQLTADQIEARLADKTVKFENMNTGAKVLVYYDGGNGMVLKPVGSEKTLDGFYATDLANHVCLGIRGKEPMRLRCVNVLMIDGAMHKFELDGSLRGRIIESVDGNMI